MKILVPTHPVLHGGGIATVVRGCVPALQEAAGPGDEIVPLLPHSHRSLALDAIGKARGGLARLAYEQLALPGRARQADTVHLFDARAPLLSGRPVVLTVHD